MEENEISSNFEYSVGQPFKQLDYQTSAMVPSAFLLPSSASAVADGVQHITQPIHFSPTEIVKELVCYLVERVESIIDIYSRAGRLAIKQTLQVLVNDPNLGILFAKQNIPQHEGNVLQSDAEPKATAFIDRGVGHVKLHLGTKQHSSILSSQTNQLAVSKKLVKKNKHLPSAHIPKNQTTNSNFVKDTPAIEQINYQPYFKHYECVALEKNLRALNTDKSQNDSHYINFLRHVKVDKNGKESPIVTIRQPNIQAIALKSNSVWKKNILQTNSLNIKKMDNFESEKDVKVQRQKTLLTEQGQENPGIDELRPLNRVRKKKPIHFFKFQELVTVKEGQVKANSYSFCNSQVFQTQTKARKGRKLFNQDNNKPKKGIDMQSLKRQCLPNIGCNKEKQIWKKLQQQVQESDKMSSLHRKNYVVLPSINIRMISNQEISHFNSQQIEEYVQDPTQKAKKKVSTKNMHSL